MACASASGVSRFTLILQMSPQLRLGLRKLPFGLRELSLGLVERRLETGAGRFRTERRSCGQTSLRDSSAGSDIRETCG